MALNDDAKNDSLIIDINWILFVFNEQLEHDMHVYALLLLFSF